MHSYLDPRIQCGNRSHPDGAWHPAQPESLKPHEQRIHKARAERWGCSCPSVSIPDSEFVTTGHRVIVWVVFSIAVVAVSGLWLKAAWQ